MSYQIPYSSTYLNNALTALDLGGVNMKAPAAELIDPANIVTAFDQFWQGGVGNSLATPGVVNYIDDLNNRLKELESTLKPSTLVYPAGHPQAGAVRSRSGVATFTILDERFFLKQAETLKLATFELGLLLEKNVEFKLPQPPGEPTNGWVTDNLVTDTSKSVLENKTTIALIAKQGITFKNGADAEVGFIHTDGYASLTGSLRTTSTSFDLIETTATTINFAGAANTINIGNSGTSTVTTLKSRTLVGTDTTQNVFNATATTVNAFGDATTLNLGTTTANATYSIATGATLDGNTKTVNIGTNGVTGSITNVVIGSATTDSTITLRSNEILGASASQELFNTVATTMNFAGDVTTFNLGGTRTTGTLQFNIGHNITTSGTKTMNLGTGATTGTTNVNIGASIGATTVRSTTVTLSNATTFNIDGNDPILAAGGTGTLTLFDTAPSTIVAFLNATTVSLGRKTGTSTFNISTGASTTGTKTLNLGTGGTTGSTTNINIGSNIAGTTTINSKTLALPSGATITGPSSGALAFFNSGVTSVTAFSAATTVTMASAKIVSQQYQSTIATGTAPLVVASTTRVDNLTTQYLYDSAAATHKDSTWYRDWANITNKPDPTITLAGDLSGSITLTDVTGGTLTATIVTDAVALGTDTTGSYVAKIIQGSANQVLVSSNDVETAAVTLTLPQDIHNAASPTFTKLTLSQTTGTAPFTLSSTTLVSNLNADLLDGQQGSWYQDWANVTNKPDPVITLAGDLSGSVTLTNLASGTLTATIVTDAVELGANTTGSYVRKIIQGSANQVVVSSNDVESADVTLSLPQNIHTAATPTFGGLTVTNGPKDAQLLVEGDIRVTGDYVVEGETKYGGASIFSGFVTSTTSTTIFTGLVSTHYALECTVSLKNANGSALYRLLVTASTVIGTPTQYYADYVVYGETGSGTAPTATFAASNSSGTLTVTVNPSVASDVAYYITSLRDTTP